MVIQDREVKPYQNSGVNGAFCNLFYFFKVQYNLLSNPACQRRSPASVDDSFNPPNPLVLRRNTECSHLGSLQIGRRTLAAPMLEKGYFVVFSQLAHDIFGRLYIIIIYNIRILYYVLYIYILYAYIYIIYTYSLAQSLSHVDELSPMNHFGWFYCDCLSILFVDWLLQAVPHSRCKSVLIILFSINRVAISHLVVSM